MRSPRRRSYSRSSSRERRRRHSRRDSRERSFRDHRRRSPGRRSPRSDRDLNRGNNVYIANFPPEATETQLKELFSSHGTVEDVRIIKRYESQESKGFGFVTFQSVRDAENAIEALDGTDFQGHALSVQKAKRSRPRESRRSSGARRSPATRSRSRSN